MMSASTETLWRLDLSSVEAAGETYAFHGPDVSANWTFAFRRDPLSPASVVVCSLSSAGKKSIGSGVGLTIKQALTCSFAEAWERHCIRDYSEGLARACSSNGFAAGATRVNARQAARAELCERAILLQAWRSRRGWTPTEFRGPLARFLAASLFLKGWCLRGYVVSTTGLGNIFASVATHEKLGALFDSAYFANGDSALLQASQIKVLFSLLKQQTLRGTEAVLNATLPNYGDPRDHGNFYRDVSNLEAFGFLNFKDAQRSFCSLGSGSAIHLEPVAEIRGFPFVWRASNPYWPELGWGRSSIQGDNPWPHPLA